MGKQYQGRTNKIIQNNLQNEVISLDSQGYNPTEISRILNRQYSNLSISRMSVTRFLNKIEENLEDDISNGNYHLNDVVNRSRNSLNSLKDRVDYLFQEIYDNTKLTRKKREYLYRQNKNFKKHIDSATKEIIYLKCYIEEREKGIKEFLKDFSRELSPESRERVVKLLE